MSRNSSLLTNDALDRLFGPSRNNKFVSGGADNDPFLQQVAPSQVNRLFGEDTSMSPVRSSELSDFYVPDKQSEHRDLFDNHTQEYPSRPVNHDGLNALFAHDDLQQLQVAESNRFNQSEQNRVNQVELNRLHHEEEIKQAELNRIKK
jgi:hypothetical protein